MSAKFTPGPWAVGRMLNPKNAMAIIGDGDTVVAIMPSDWNFCTYSPDDARLIAAAPDLLEALKDAVEYMKHHLPDEVLAPHLAAIAKASGEQP